MSEYRARDGRGRSEPLPEGFHVVLDSDTRLVGTNALYGGSPPRIVKLTAAGRRAFAQLRSGPVQGSASGRLARRLTDGGLAHPRPPRTELPITVVIPVRDRQEELGRCLSAVGRDNEVIVVDDGSREPGPTAALCREHGARLLRHETALGPGAARNTALAHVRTDVVAFLDSDCVPPPDWLPALAAHLADPLVGAVAARISPVAPGRRTAARYIRASSPLDLGARPALVAPLTRVSYVPTAALLVRVAALGDGFAAGLRYGEDVDLVWRLGAAGWRVRYDPSVEVGHTEPRTWPAVIARRYRYGTSAASLHLRHPGCVAPLVLRTWPTLAVAAALSGRPLVAAAAVATGAAVLRRRVTAAGVPQFGTLGRSAHACVQTWLGVGRWAGQFAWPLLLVGVARRGRRLAAASLLFGPPLAAWRTLRPDLDPMRFTVARIIDEAAYGAGVWHGCLRERSFAALVPVMHRSGRFGSAPAQSKGGRTGRPVV